MKSFVEIVKQLRDLPETVSDLAEPTWPEAPE